MNAFGQLAPQINQIFNSEDTLFGKIEKFTENYISFVLENPYMPQFIVQELNNNPEFAQKLLHHPNRPNPQNLIVQINKEIELGIIKPIHPKQLLLDIISMTVFPFAAQIMARGIIGISEEEFQQLMQERKTHIANQIINAIKK